MAVVWNILQLERQISTGGIYAAHWLVEDHEVVDDIIHVGRVADVETLEVDPSSESFTPYADVTEEQVITWVKASLGSEVDTILNSVATQIEESKTPTTAKGTPW